MQLYDAITITDKRTSSEGFLAVRASAARTGVYDYLAREVGAPDTFKPNDTVKIYRPADEVFNPQSMASFIAKPITNNHPSQNVTADNWAKLAKGAIQKVGKSDDGKFLDFDLAFMDGATIAALNGGKRELSNGYSCELDWTAGVADDGDAYDAVQRNIRGNHVALVDQGRAGPSCAVTDKFAICDSNPNYEGNIMTTKTITFDGLPLVTTDAGEAAINKLLGQIADMSAKAKKMEEDKEEDMKKGAVKDAKIIGLEQQLADAKITPEKLRDAAKSYALVAGKTKALGVTVTDSMNEADMVKAAVTAKLGDKAKGWNDDQFKAVFDSFESDAVRDAFSGVTVNTNDAASIRSQAYQGYIDSLTKKAA